MKNIIITVIILTILYSCTNEPVKEKVDASVSEKSVQLTDAQLKNSEISTQKIEKKPISGMLKVNGKIDVPPQNMVFISAPLGGYLKSTKLLEGMHIKKGEVIAVMEDQQYIQLQQDYLMAKAQFSSLEKEFHRQKELNESKATSDKIFENTQAEYLSQKVRIKSLSEKLKLISIDPEKLNENTLSRSVNVYSPIDGFVSSVKMNIGKYVNPTDVLFELVNPSDIHLALTVFEKDIDKIYIGQKIMAFSNNQPDKKFNCEIILIGKDISPERSVTVHCHFDQYDKSLLPGMYMNAEIKTTTVNDFVIQNEGLVNFEGKQYVFMQLNKNKFEIIEVTAHNTDNGFTQISFIENIDADKANFVTKGAYTLLMTMKNTEE